MSYFSPSDPQALRLVTEIIHRCLSRRAGRELASGMTAERFEEMTSVDAMSSGASQLQIPMPTSPTNASDDSEGLHSFRRDLAHGLLSRRRLENEAYALSLLYDNVLRNSIMIVLMEMN